MQIPCGSPISEVRGLDNLKITKNYPRGSVLFAEGQRPRGVYVLCEGRAKVSVGSAEGKTFVLRIAEVGDLLGVNSILTGRPSSATVETLERRRIDFVSREDFLKLLDRDKKAYLGVAHALSSKLDGVTEHARIAPPNRISGGEISTTISSMVLRARQTDCSRHSTKLRSYA